MNRQDIGYSLTEGDLKEIASKLGLKIKVLLYKQLAKLSPKQFYKLLEQNTGLILLYPNGSHLDARGDFRGHWVTVMLHPEERLIEFFDPIAQDNQGKKLLPDQELSWDPRQVNRPWLSRFLLQLPFELEYNDHKLQRIASGIATCGKHALLRLLLKDLPLDSYYDLVKFGAEEEKESTDRWVNDLLAPMF